MDRQAVAGLVGGGATCDVVPDSALVSAMSKQAVSKSGEFDPQNVANLMWALTKCGVSPDAALVSAMSRQPVS